MRHAFPIGIIGRQVLVCCSKSSLDALGVIPKLLLRVFKIQMKFNVYDRLADNLSRPLIVILIVEAVYSRRMVGKVERDALNQRVLNKAVDRIKHGRDLIVSRAREEKRR